ncbi:baseplate J/gp47 family protein [Paenibacillus soyae]|uniref:Baseplate J/gp47 family protein n=1 Tax=Paenibacillus soyae TaxID=2969249 RepID=A0A9X2S980_9BACL|nr:baseplate J/gp47 family protein [Paenibacillus soyae]MCR2802447.1 baseplate J/gp47 family protein [Paenibacillus soyae]
MNQAGSGRGDVRPPKINTNSLSTYMDKFKQLAPHYTPEWRFSLEQSDAGASLAYIAGEMLEDTVQRLNGAPMNHLLSFLDLIEVKLKPPRPSRANVVFKLSEGASAPVYIPQGFTLTAPNPSGGDPLLFETEEPLAATPARLMEIVNANPVTDEIVTAARSYADRLEAGAAAPIPFFDTTSMPNEQEHALFVRHDDQLLTDRPCRIFLNVHHAEKKYSEPELAASLASAAVEWQYSSGGRWLPFQSVTAAGNTIILHKSIAGKLELTEHEGVEGRWIKCSLKSVPGEASPLLKRHLEMDKIRLRASHDVAGDSERIKPDGLYFNDLELMPEGFYPFGEHFVPYSVFYLSCEEAFSKRRSKLELTFSAIAKGNRLRMAPDPEIKWKMLMRTYEFEEKDPPRVRIRQVLWEYWNGSNWNALPGGEQYGEFFADLPEEHPRSFAISFQCPDDMTQTFVNGTYQYWIRARVIQTDPIIAPVVQYMSPWLANPKLSYATSSQVVFEPDNVFTRNNADNRDRSLSASEGISVFKPFEPIPSDDPSTYLGFDSPPAKGPLRLHIELLQRYAAEQDGVWLEWEALCWENGRFAWTPLKVTDGTSGFGVSGDWMWAGPATMVPVRLFGHERYWIRVVNRDRRLSEAYPNHPIAGSLYMNAVAVSQQASVELERVIPENGLLTITPSAFTGETVWIDERELHTTAECHDLMEANPSRYEAVRDGEGNILRFWVRWEPVASLLESGPNDRHYCPDHAGGLLQFGDGTRGRAPSGERDGMARISFKLTAGASGRVEAGQITGMQRPVAFISGVSNPKPSVGGSHTETLEAVLRRGPQQLKHRGRAVTARDAEWIAREAHPGIAKVKCLSNRNGQLEKSPGFMTIVACTDGGLEHAAEFPEVRRIVEDELHRSASSLLTVGGAIRVIEPAYLEVSVHATVAAESALGLVPLEKACELRLRQFLNFMSGNTDGQGWEIGEPLHLSLLHSQLHAVRGLLYIERLYVHVVKIENGIRAEWDPARMGEVLNGLVISGTHQITAIPAPHP